MAGTWHKWPSAAVAALIGLAFVLPAQAQEVDEPPVLSTAQAFSLVGATAMYGLSVYMNANAGQPTCAPCDPETLPWFDRFAVGPPNPVMGYASDFLVLGLGGTSLLDTGFREERRGGVVVTLEAVAWTFAVTEIAKALIKRERPIMYTDQALSVASEVNNQRSMWSGHTSVAFALAAGYWVNNPDQDLAPKVAAMFAAAGVGALRIAAHKHFLSDVLVGALVGTAGAVIVHELRY
jgi:membrane-associated phospholipid phosphatase